MLSNRGARPFGQRAAVYYFSALEGRRQHYKRNFQESSILLLGLCPLIRFKCLMLPLLSLFGVLEYISCCRVLETEKHLFNYLFN